MVLTGDVTVIKIDAWVPSPRRIGSGAGCRTVATSSGVWRIDVRTQYRPKRTERKAHVVRKMITCVLADLYRLDNVMPNIGTWKLMLSMTGLCFEAVWEAVHRTRRGPIFIRDGMFCTYLYLLLQTAQVRHTSRESISTCHLSWVC